MARAAVFACLLLVPVTTSAQEAVVGVEGSASAERLDRWTERVEAGLARPVELEARALETSPAGTVLPSRLDAISAIEALLMGSRSSRAQLHEEQALRALARAQALVERNLDVPGISAWYAEVQLAIAITAAQAGQRGLSEAALLRAASVDPSRVVQAAEARPEVVGLARTVRRARATAPRGRFYVRSNTPGASVSVDDVGVGALPRRIDLPVGPHLLRIDAPGHGSWASLIQVREGARPPLEVALSPLPSLRGARRAIGAATLGDRDALVSALSTWSNAPRVRMVWAGDGERDRALSQACDGERCGALQRHEADARLALSFDGPDEGHASALRWLREPNPIGAPSNAEWYTRWELWVSVAAALLVGAAIGTGVAIDYAQQPSEPAVTIIDEFSNP